MKFIIFSACIMVFLSQIACSRQIAYVPNDDSLILRNVLNSLEEDQCVIEELAVVEQEIDETGFILKNNVMYDNHAKYINLRSLFASEGYVFCEFRSLGESLEDRYKVLQARYGLFSVYTVVSVPVYNQDKTLAIVYLSIFSDLEDGYGSIVYLQKVNGKWQIYDEETIWVA